MIVGQGWIRKREAKLSEKKKRQGGVKGKKEKLGGNKKQKAEENCKITFS